MCMYVCLYSIVMFAWSNTELIVTSVLIKSMLESINMPSPPQGTTAIHTRVSTEYLPTWSILAAAGRATGPEISASQWLNCVRAILHCWRPTCIASDVETQPLVHIAMVLTRRQNIWCYTAQHTTRGGGSHGQISTIKATQDAYGASWSGSGRWPDPQTGNERERAYALPKRKLEVEGCWDCWLVAQWRLQRDPCRRSNHSEAVGTVMRHLCDRNNRISTCSQMYRIHDLLLLLLLLSWSARQALPIWVDNDVRKRWGIPPDSESGWIHLYLVIVDSHLLTGAPLKGTRAAVVAHSWCIVDHCQTIDVDGCRQTVKLHTWPGPRYASIIHHWNRSTYNGYTECK